MKLIVESLQVGQITRSIVIMIMKLWIATQATVLGYSMEIFATQTTVSRATQATVFDY
jgi:hypothetical protein